jgi:hypothetical protein
VPLPAAATGAGAEVPAPKRKPASRSTSCSPSKKHLTPTGGQLKTFGASQAEAEQYLDILVQAIEDPDPRAVQKLGTYRPCPACCSAAVVHVIQLCLQ